MNRSPLGPYLLLRTYPNAVLVIPAEELHGTPRFDMMSLSHYTLEQ